MEAMAGRSRELLLEQGPSAFGVYTTGQLFLEEYYTLPCSPGRGRAPTNTRLCTATAAEALKETFASDGQPGSCADVDHCDVLFLVGHNVAETQVTLWARMLDRLEGPHPPKPIVVDPRPTVPARHADDVVLPAATWGEKEGTFTNTDRTVHHSDKAVEPPGEARSDLDIFLEYARRMDFRDRGGAPLVKWHDPESAFEPWQACTAGRPCDYTGLSYDGLRAGGETQWPCNARFPDGRERLYTDGDFYADPGYCESYGRDLVTGTALEPFEYRALNPDGKAMIKAAEYLPPAEEPGDEYPLRLNTGRTVYHFHTRTKTGRAPQLVAAAPDVWVELSDADAAAHGISERDLVEVVTARGRVRARARVTDIRAGVVFVPFHYGYWDVEERGDGHDRAANEMTITDSDPVSKQPIYKTAACRVERVADDEGGVAPAPTTTASRPLARVAPTVGGPAADASEEIRARRSASR
jgi:anaerobic selenocysteine-containing dehydrogenase